MRIVAPGTLKHVGEKTIHLAATNLTDGTSKNTNCIIPKQVGKEWKTFSEIVKSHRAMLVPMCLHTHVVSKLCVTHRRNQRWEMLFPDPRWKGCSCSHSDRNWRRTGPIRLNINKLIRNSWNTSTSSRRSHLVLSEARTSPGLAVRQEFKQVLRNLSTRNGRLRWWYQTSFVRLYGQQH